MHQLNTTCYKKTPVKFLIETRFLIEKLLTVEKKENKYQSLYVQNLKTKTVYNCSYDYIIILLYKYCIENNDHTCMIEWMGQIILKRSDVNEDEVLLLLRYLSARYTQLLKKKSIN